MHGELAQAVDGLDSFVDRGLGEFLTGSGFASAEIGHSEYIIPSEFHIFEGGGSMIGVSLGELTIGSILRITRH